MFTKKELELLYEAVADKAKMSTDRKWQRLLKKIEEERLTAIGMEVLK